MNNNLIFIKNFPLRNNYFLENTSVENIKLIYTTDKASSIVINSISYNFSGDTLIIIHSFSPFFTNKAFENGFFLGINPQIISIPINNPFLNQYIFPLINKKGLSPIIIQKKEFPEIFDRLKNLFFILKDTSLNKKFAYELRIKGQIFDILGILYEENLLKIVKFDKKEEERINAILKIIDFIKDNYKKNIKLETLAELVSFETTYFSKFFKKYIGYNFSEYLNSYRISKAIELLESTKLSTTEICYECGFNELSYFIKVFKRKNQITPNKYRANYHKKS